MTEAEKKVTRFELIGKNKRIYSKYGCSVRLDYQDDGKTLKVFIDDNEPLEGKLTLAGL